MSYPDLTTLARLPFHISERFPDQKLVNRCRDGGSDGYSSREYFERIRDLSLGLTSLGLRPGDRFALICDSRPEWGIADLAGLTAGGVTVPIYPTHSASQMRHILHDSGSRLAIVSNDTQVEKLRQVLDQLPRLETILVIDATTGSADGHPPVLSVAEVSRRGRAVLDGDAKVAQRYRERAFAPREDDLATIIYTSGTTGEPKGVMLTHDNIMSNVRASTGVLLMTPADVALTFLPLSHVFERMVFYRYLHDGVKVCFAESLTTVSRDLLQVKPTVMTGVPRVYEKFYAAIQDAVRKGSGLKRKLFQWAVSVGQAKTRSVLAGRRLSPLVALQLPIAERIVFRKIRAGTGGRLKTLVSGSAPLPRSIAEFFMNIGMPIIEAYGLTETSPALTANPIDAIRPGTVGKALEGIDIKIAPDGEILARGPNVMVGYYGRPDLTEEVMKDGWFHTGDIGELDADGYLTITDRKKDLIVTSGGKKIAPQPLENLLKSDPLIAEAVVIGEERKFPAVLIVPNFALLEARAGTMGLPGTPHDTLVKRPEIAQLYQAVLDRLNEKLAQFERIKRFALLPTEFTMERDELTPTMKVRRKVVEDRWRGLIDQMYATPAPTPSGSGAPA